MAEQPHDIVVVGGGAGGLELVTALGKSLSRRDRARSRWYWTVDP